MGKLNEKNRVAVYYRVSKENNGDTELNNQRDELRRYAAENGYTIVEEIGEIAKGSTLDRAGIDRVYQLGSEGKIDKVLVCNSSRITRSFSLIDAFCDKLKGYGIAVESMKEGAVDKQCEELKEVQKYFPFLG